ncbi:MAG: MarR family transcriptional regulator [Bacteroidales bacterium]|nr:MarR family transcriptional regulator [Bacteroidales bacterium]
MERDLAKYNPYMKMVINIMKAGNIIDHKVSEVLKEFEITHIQFNILRNLEVVYPEKISVADVTQGLLYPTSDVTRLLDRLEKRNLISRVICPKNRRKMDISITEHGLEIIDKAMPKIAEVLESFYNERVSDEERDKVSEVMKRLIN